MSTLSDSTTPAPAAPAPQAAGGIDPRGPQFGAALTTVILAAVLLVPTPVAIGLLAFQTVLFGLGVGLGVARTPYAWLFKNLVRPRLGAPSELEDPRPPRFAQAVGLGFAVAGLVSYVAGAVVLGQVFVGFALAAAFLNAAFAFCLGCEMYLLLARLRAR
ncbi:DUF4395 domain-containing protein [Nocardioidaceae bacterium]|nr:DUF4395 domain-containing protein [Nocardioidaceae bacterium]